MQQITRAHLQQLKLVSSKVFSSLVKAHVVLASTNGVSPNHLPVIVWPATDHEPHCRHAPINKI